MPHNELMKKILEQTLINELLSRTNDEERERAMKMIEEITSGVQAHMDRIIPAIDSIPPTQLEKILRDQVK